MATNRKPLHCYWTPRHWLHWFALCVLRVVALFPLGCQLRFGKSLGRLAHRFDRKRRTFARRNVQLCFPEMSPAERDALVLAHYEARGASIREVTVARWASDQTIADIVQVEGAEYLTEALERREPVMLLTGHFTVLELMARPLLLIHPQLDIVYQDQYIAVLEEQIRRCPEQYVWTYRKFKGRPESLPYAYADVEELM